MCSSADQFFTFHCERDQLRKGERASVQFVQAENGCCGTGGAGADPAARAYFFLDDDFQAGLFAGGSHKSPYSRGDDVFFDVFGEFGRACVADRKAVPFGYGDAQHVSDAIQGHAHDIEPAPEISGRSRGENPDRFVDWFHWFENLRIWLFGREGERGSAGF